MRIALISDLHGHLAGLRAALADLEVRGCHRVVCLGDLVEGGDDNDAVVDEVRERGLPCVRGNHDEYNEAPMRRDNRLWLTQLPDRLQEGDRLFIHVSPRQRKITGAIEAWNVLDDCAARLIFVGHNHVPRIYGLAGGAVREAREHAFAYGQAFALHPDDRYLVMVGSLAYGRDPVGRLRYLIFDEEAQTVEHRLLDGPLLEHLDWTTRRVGPPTARDGP